MLNNNKIKQLKEIVGPAIAVDVAAFTVEDGVLKVLLLKPKDKEAEKRWVLPGAFVGLSETLDEAAGRALDTKANININYLEQLYTFGKVTRDTRGRVVSCAFVALVDAKKFQLKTSENYVDIMWIPVRALPPTGYDHTEIIALAIKRIRNKIQYSNIACHLLPTLFTLTNLQNVYEAILDRKIDKRNFRRKALTLGVIKPIEGRASIAANRPAQLFRFLSKSYEEVAFV